MKFDSYLDRISERNVGRFDAFALFDDVQIFKSVIADYASPFRDCEIDAVVGIDAIGFVVGAGVALELNVGFLPVRKGGKLPIPEEDRLQRQVTDYTGEQKTLEIDAAPIFSGMRTLVVDDWMETAAQMEAAVDLVEEADGTVAGIAVLDTGENERTRTLAAEYNLHTLNPTTDF
ncbi:MAG: phosphoribosyltransferase family protein [Halohasta sp.]